MNHHVYFAECQGFIKIGYTRGSLKSRLSNIQANNPFKITILGSIECECDCKSKPTLGTQSTCAKEAELHALFLYSQVKYLHPETEWFCETPELRAYIDKNAD